jgi:methylmalonyl-CoA/ethylmalonyl-CoA epimerase
MRTSSIDDRTERRVIEFVNIDHISQAVPNADAQAEFLTRVLGLRPAQGDYRDTGFRAVTLAIPGSSRVGWEIMEPAGDESFLHRFLDGPRGPGLHHLAMRVESVEAARASIRELGAEPWGQEEQSTYLHPASGGHGFLFQFFEGENWYQTEPFEDEGEHTLGIIAVNHLAHAYPDRDELGEWYERTLGFETFWRSAERIEDAKSEFQTRVMEAPTKQMRVEVISPAGENSFIQRFLDQRGPGAHHLTVEVADWDRAVAALAHHEVRSFGEREGKTDGVPWREAFIHPKATGGVLVQFFWQAEPGHWI